MIRICVIVFVAWIVLSVPTVLLFGALVRAGRRQTRAGLTVAGDVSLSAAAEVTSTVRSRSQLVR